MARIKMFNTKFYDYLREEAETTNLDTGLTYVDQYGLIPGFNGLTRMAGAISITKKQIMALNDIVLGEDSAHFTTKIGGNFKYGPLDTVKGTIKSISVFEGTTLIAKITGLKVDASVGWPALNASHDSSYNSSFPPIRTLFNKVFLKGNDTFIGGDGHDYMGPSKGNDKAFGGDGYDFFRGGAGKDELHGDGGNDHLRGNRGDDTLFGGDGDDLMRGDLGNDQLDGGAGNDTLEGHAGDDFFDGGAGDDILKGSEKTFIWGVGSRERAGADTFFFEDGDGTDTVEDFDVAVDVIQIDTDNNIFLTDIDGTAQVTFGDVVINFVGLVRDDFTGANFEYL